MIFSLVQDVDLAKLHEAVLALRQEVSDLTAKNLSLHQEIEALKAKPDVMVDVDSVAIKLAAVMREDVDAQDELIDGLHKRLLLFEKAVRGVRAVWEAASPKEYEQLRDRERDKYSELIMTVEQKYPGETRHETALRYIKDGNLDANGSSETTKEMKDDRTTDTPEA